MKKRSRHTTSEINQIGSILPVTLMLGLGLMYGVAGVVNLGFSQNEEAAAQRERLVASFTTQYLNDHDFRKLGSTDLNNASRLAQIPLPSSAYVLTSSNSCLADRPSNREGYGALRDPGSAGLTLADVRFVAEPTSTTTVTVPGNTDAADGEIESAIEYVGREVFWLTLASGAQLEPEALGEEPRNNLFGHFWVKVTEEAWSNFASGTEKVRIPLLTHLQPPSATPGLEIFLEYDPYNTIGSPSGSDAFRGVRVLARDESSSSPLTLNVASAPLESYNGDGDYNHSDNEWLSVAFWVTKSPKERPKLGLYITDRGRSSINNTVDNLEFGSANSPVAFNINSRYLIGGLAKFLDGSGNEVTGDSMYSASKIGLKVSSFRVWQKYTNILHASVSASASQAIEDLMEFDARYPGDYFDSAEMPTLLREGAGNFNLVHYTTFDKTRSDSTDPRESSLSNGRNRLLWQPSLGDKSYASTSASVTLESRVIGGNAGSADLFGNGGHAGPPSPNQVYLIHSCDENGYTTLKKVRRYVRNRTTEDRLTDGNWNQGAEEIIWR